MKRFSHAFVLAFVLFTFVELKANGQDPYSYYTYIYRTPSGWNLNMKFLKSGLLEAIKKEDPQVGEIASDSVFTVIATKYLEGKVGVRINRNIDIEIAYPKYRINENFFEINYEMKITARPHYWDITLSAMEENPKNTVYLKLHDQFDSDTFILGKRYGTTISLEEKRNGDFIVYK